MQLKQAREILGLGPDEDPRPHLAGLNEVRERIAALVREAPNDVIAIRYQEHLQDFDCALAALRENDGGMKPDDRDEFPDAGPAHSDVPAGRARLWVMFWLVLLMTGAGVAWYVLSQSEHQQWMRQERVRFLQREGTVYIENRRWEEAARSFAEVEMLVPGSDVARRGREDIEAGMAEEKTQFVGYWTGQALAELEAGRLDEAEAAARRVLDAHPTETDAAAIMERVAEAREGQSQEAALEAALEMARQAMDDRRWADAIKAARGVLDFDPGDSEAGLLIAEAAAAIRKAAADREMARNLYEQAVALDQGEFNQQALDLLREASGLAPDDAEVAARLEKMASYTRTIRVPGDFNTPAEALAAARDRDRVVLAEQTWKGALVINAGVELQGAGSGKTIIECAADDDNVLVIGPEARDARITGITFRHESFHATGSDRFSAAVVRGGSASFSDCHFTNASGHGLAVIGGGRANAVRCRFAENGWNGAAAVGEGSVLDIRDSEAMENIEHGIESWDGAAVTLVNNRCEANCRNGIHADNHKAAAWIQGNRLVANREFGLVLDSAGSGKIFGNTARANLLGGVVVGAAAEAVPVTGNLISANEGPGLVLEKGLQTAAYSDNRITQNAKSEILDGVDLAGEGE